MNNFNKEEYVAKACSIVILNKKYNEMQDHKDIPMWLIELKNRFCNKLSNKFLLQFYEALNINCNFITVRQKFLIFVLEDVKQYYDNDKHKDVTKAINSVIELLYEDPEFKNKERFKEAANAANYAAYSAYTANAANYAAYAAANAANAANAAYAAANAAYAAYAAYTANYAAYAAYSAANSAYTANAANSAANAANYAAYSAYTANAANSAANSAANAANYAAYSATTQKHADKLIELLRGEV